VVTASNRFDKNRKESETGYILEIFWKLPPNRLEIDEGQVHIWRFSICPEAEVGRCTTSLLSQNELIKSRAFHFEKDRRRYIFHHAWLRRILAHYLDTAPEKVRFCEGVYGKPALAPPFEREMLQFNISHSYDALLIAVTRNRRVGIDVEKVRDIREVEEILSRYFLPEENQAYHTLGEAEKMGFFFRLWVRKEAVIKAQGWTLSRGLAEICIPTRLGETEDGKKNGGTILTVREPDDELRKWTLSDIDAFSDYMSAICVEGDGCQFSGFEIPAENYMF
jgi:4'-phosphopantetheinyl transferase